LVGSFSVGIAGETGAGETADVAEAAGGAKVVGGAGNTAFWPEGELTSSTVVSGSTVACGDRGADVPKTAVAGRSTSRNMIRATTERRIGSRRFRCILAATYQLGRLWSRG
jgi:hypothetical protein